MKINSSIEGLLGVDDLPLAGLEDVTECLAGGEDDKTGATDSRKNTLRKSHSLENKEQQRIPRTRTRRQLGLDNKDKECGTPARQHSFTAVPIAGALVVGACLGGPVGLLAGMKVGALVGLGGSVIGYTSASKMEQHL